MIIGVVAIASRFTTNLQIELVMLYASPGGKPLVKGVGMIFAGSQNRSVSYNSVNAVQSRICGVGAEVTVAGRKRCYYIVWGSKG